MKYLSTVLLFAFYLVFNTSLFAQAPAPPPPDDPPEGGGSGGSGSGGGGGGTTLPPDPVTSVSQTHYCEYTVLRPLSTPPVGYAWYWQVSRSGTSTSHSASSNGTYTATSATTYYIRTYYAPSNTWSDEYESLRVTVSSSSFKVKPPTPSSPSFKYNCDNTVLTRGSHPSGFTLYWQNSATGTSQTNSSSTKTFTSSGTYYLRARNNSTGCWSDARYGDVKVGQGVLSGPPPREGAPPPEKPLTCFSQSHACGVTTISRINSPPAGISWYWQTNSSGTNKNKEAKDYQVSSTGTYYLRAYDLINNSWSDGATGVTVSSSNFLVKPANPILTVEEYCGSTLLIANNSSSETWYWQSNSTSKETNDTRGAITKTSPGTVHIRAKHNTSGCWSNTSTESYSIREIPAVPAKPEEEVRSPGITTLIKPDAPVIPGTDEPDPLLILYWQTTPDGESQSNKDDEYNVYEDGRVWLRAFHKLSECWSGTTAVDYSVDYNPNPPKIGETDFQCGLTVYEMDSDELANRSNEAWYWQRHPDEMKTDPVNAASQYSVSNAILVPELYLRAKNLSTGFWSDPYTISVEVKGTPGKPIGEDKSLVCWRESIELSANHSGDILNWYETESSETPIHTGNIFPINNVENDQSYWVASEKEGCLSSKEEISVTMITHSPRELNFSTNPKNPCGPFTITNEDGLGAGSPYYFLGKSKDPFQATLFEHDHEINQSGKYYFALGSSHGGGVCLSQPIDTLFTLVEGVVDPEYTLDGGDCKPNILTVPEIEGQEIIWSFDEPKPIGDDQYEISETGNYNFEIKKIQGCEETLVFGPGQLFITLQPQELEVIGGGYVHDNPKYYKQIYLRDAEYNVDYEVFDVFNESKDAWEGIHRDTSIILDIGSYRIQAKREIEDADGPTGTYCVQQLGDVHIIEAGRNFVDQSFVSTRSYLIPVQEDQTFVARGASVAATTYLDESGRPLQSIVEGASPNGKDLIRQMSYDSFGRSPRSYLPFAKEYDGMFHPESMALADQSNFYTNEPGVAHDSHPYSQVQYDGSPFHRVTEVTGVGENWHENNRSLKNHLLSNTEADSVIHWGIIADELQQLGMYPKGQLRKQEVHTEDNHTSIAFLNKSGQLILSRIQAPEADGGWADTYSVYDVYGNLIMVIPPAALELLNK